MLVRAPGEKLQWPVGSQARRPCKEKRFLEGVEVVVSWPGASLKYRWVRWLGLVVCLLVPAGVGL